MPRDDRFHRSKTVRRESTYLFILLFAGSRVSVPIGPEMGPSDATDVFETSISQRTSAYE
ncbi:uncharacterized protein N7477_009428 [Penicillium maclennaniae]|uniref:uncharacterized protein n=1 Tax=Penicillium maclennaniae TaxID=1343394 RepID=UPI00253FCA8D|nr:uncharacterized protein N7477_009428 [Penicillium maclennaniae]KAJ5661812.1 hypothetical protein N7477_009428 [Penicillium maclennaniae]